jgi:hypothetical protein
MTTTYEKAAPVSRAELNLARTIADAELRTIRRTKRANNKFNRATPAERRVIVAKDVLMWLNSGKLTPGHTYLGLRAHAGQAFSFDLRDVGLQDAGVKKVNGYDCQACARGALFAVVVERDVAPSIMAPFSKQYVADGPAEMRGALEEAGFEGPQVALIECAYEGSSAFIPGTPSQVCTEAAKTYGYDAVEKAHEWRRRITDDSERMRAIMQNIIANGGTFVP